MVVVVFCGEEWLGFWCCDLFCRVGRWIEDVGVKYLSWYGVLGK